jgi:hypothetical protein
MKRTLSSAQLILLSFIIFVISALATPCASFAFINITHPFPNGSYPDYVLIEGSSDLEQFWLCLQGPNGEIAYYPLQVTNNLFHYDLCLRFGTGKYNIWVGETPETLDSQSKITVTNHSPTDLRYQASSAYIDCNHHSILELNNSIIKPEMIASSYFGFLKNKVVPCNNTFNKN